MNEKSEEQLSFSTNTDDVDVRVSSQQCELVGLPFLLNHHCTEAKNSNNTKRTKKGTRSSRNSQSSMETRHAKTVRNLSGILTSTSHMSCTVDIKNNISKRKISKTLFFVQTTDCAYMLQTFSCSISAT